MPTSSEEIALIEQIAKLDGLRELLEDDIAEPNPTQANFTNVEANHPPFKQLYLDVRVAFRRYKNKFVPSTVTEEQFNDPESQYSFKDAWMLETKKTFQRVNNSIVIFLNKAASSNSESQEEKLNVAGKVEFDRLASKIKSESKQLTSALDDSFKTLQSATHINPNQSQIHASHQQNLMSLLDDKLPALLASLSLSAGPGDGDQVKLANTDYAVLEGQEKPRLYKLVHLIAEKTQFVPVTSSSNSSTARPASFRSETVHLKKVDPPTFSGDEVDFPEFHRKWLAVVGPAHLPEEAEVDRLRDALPKDVKEMLTGVHKRDKAWDILTKRFGDKDLIATTLKNQLKNLSILEKSDHEKMITLTIKVRSLVTRLESLGASEALKHDGEFISAIYFQLPDR